MTQWSWETITERYKSLASGRPNTPYADYAMGMLELLPKLRSQLRPDDVRVGMALHTLTLGFDDSQRTVHVDWEKPNFFAIYLDYCEGSFYGEKVTVSLQDAVGKVEEYLRRIKHEKNI
jgi:hypothetical protein